MIKSEAQLERTKTQIDGFKQAMAQLQKNLVGLTEVVLNAVIASHQGMIAKLEFEIAEYEDTKRGVIQLPRLASPRDFGVHLCKFRIALGISQEQLAEMVGVSRQTINRHEEQEYQLASVDLITRVSEVLGLLPEIHVKHKTLDVKQPASAA